MRIFMHIYWIAYYNRNMHEMAPYFVFNKYDESGLKIAPPETHPRTPPDCTHCEMIIFYIFMPGKHSTRLILSFNIIVVVLVFRVFYPLYWVVTSCTPTIHLCINTCIFVVPTYIVHSYICTT